MVRLNDVTIWRRSTRDGGDLSPGYPCRREVDPPSLSSPTLWCEADPGAWPAGDDRDQPEGWSPASASDGGDP